jgi:hypothetical protein
MNYFVDPMEGFGRCAEKVLEFIKAENLKTEVRNGILFVGPRSKVHDDLRWMIRDHAPELTALVAVKDEDVAWRAGAMLRQLTGLVWPCPVPTLHALPDAEPMKEDCGSCGELLDVGEGNSLICGACARAKDVALSLWLQRPAVSAKVA